MTSKWGFVSTQLNGVEPSASLRDATVYMLREMEKQTDLHELSDEDCITVLSYVSKLAQGHALIGETPDERWGDVIPGEYSVGDTVRVRADAYTGDHGLRHNGKRGRITAVHQAKTVVLYDDAATSEESFYHEPFNLQRLV